jgi:hypothetical protein
VSYGTLGNSGEPGLLGALPADPLPMQLTIGNEFAALNQAVNIPFINSDQLGGLRWSQPVQIDRAAIRAILLFVSHFIVTGHRAL